MNNGKLAIYTEEIEPCLHLARISATAGAGQTGQTKTKNRATEAGRGRRGWILAILLLVLFLISVLLAFLFGHWLADLNYSTNDGSSHSLDQHEGPETNEETLINLMHNLYEPSSLNDIVLNSLRNNNNRRRKSRTDDRPIFKLPANILPLHYDLWLDLSRFSLDNIVHGRLAVSFQCLNVSDEVIVHAADNIVFLSNKGYDSDDMGVSVWRDWASREAQTIPLVSVGRDSRFQIVRIRPREPLAIGWYTLKAKYYTRICSDQQYTGVQCYKSRMNGIDATISFATKFEPSLAKTFLPCWDEPLFKTTFNVTAVHRRNVTFLTNTAPMHRKVDNRTELVTSTFYPSPAMPVYLLAFAGGTLLSVSTSTQRGLPLTIWTSSKDDLFKTHYALNFSAQMIDIQERQFEKLYPLSKMDFVASRSFPVGAMENWGLVVFHANMLLIDSQQFPDMTTESFVKRHRIERIITHEIAHQWFGNLVTPATWSELWLSEGLATFYVFELMAERRPLLTQFEYLSRLSEVMRVQMSADKLALVSNFTTERQIYRFFDRLHLYTKGSVLVAMIKQLVGAEQFSSSIRQYLEKNSYKSVHSSDLWLSLPTFAPFGHSAQLLADVCQKWLQNRGFPEVTIERNYSSQLLTLRQRQSDQRLYRPYLDDFESNCTLTWPIPFSYVYRKNNTAELRRQFWFETETLNFTDMDLNSPTDYILANPDWTFAYRVNYDPQNWRLLIQQLKRDPYRIPARSRLQLLTDARLYLGQSGHICSYVDLLSYLRAETSLTAVIFGVNALFELFDAYQATSINSLLLIYLKPVVRQFELIYEESQKDLEQSALWTLDSHTLIRFYLLRCLSSSQNCLQSTKENEQIRSHTQKKPVDTKKPIDHNQQLVVLCQHLLTNSDREQETLVQSLLLRNGGRWATVLHLASCLRADSVLDTAVTQVIRRKNLAVLASLLQNGYTLHYNWKLRSKIWNGLKTLDAREKGHMFEYRAEMSRLLLHSVKSTEELRLASSGALPSLLPDEKFLQKKFHWIESVNVPRLEQWLITNHQ